MKWNEITRGSKVILAKDTVLKSFNEETRDVKAGNYYITGFWADIVGLNSKRATGENEVCIQSRELVAFENITI